MDYYNTLLEDEDDDLVMDMVILEALEYLKENEKEPSMGSVLGQRYIDRRHAMGHENLMRDYFSESSVYTDALFRRRFRMKRELFLRIADADFTKNCIFIDESGFHINMRKNYAWSRKSERAVVKLPQTRAASHTIIGAISTKGVIHIALRKPPPPPAKDTKKRARDNKGKKRAVTAVEEEADTTTSDYSQKPPPKGTTSAHYTTFINELLDILDDMGDMKGSYMVMDNCSIHGSKLMQNKILRRRYKFVYLPTYSPELNAIEQFWSLVKGKMKRDKLLQSETMSSRIKGACEQVLLSDLYGFANHSKRQISKCYDRIPF